MGKFTGTQASSAGTSWQPVSGVTAENYYDRARDCFRARGSAFLVAIDNGECQGVKYSYSAKQWGAWLAFFKARKIPYVFMLRRDWYQVPTEWPHEFCVEATVLDDHNAGSAFERELLRLRSDEKAALAQKGDKVAFATAAKTRMRGDARKVATPPNHLDVAPEIDAPWKSDMRPASHLLETGLIAR
jgi:hypothetical protein